MSEMPSTAEFWPTVFHSFRSEDHKFLVVSTNNGLEVAVQEISRIEEALVLIRGRISGTADAGRLFLLPYAQLSSVYVNRPVRREEVDLYSPSVDPAKKLEVARQVAEIERQAREDARMAEAAKNGDVDLAHALKKLDTLRDGSLGVEQLSAPAESQRALSTKAKSGRLPLIGTRAGRRLPQAPSESTDEKDS